MLPIQINQKKKKKDRVKFADRTIFPAGPLYHKISLKPTGKYIYVMNVLFIPRIDIPKGYRVCAISVWSVHFATDDFMIIFNQDSHHYKYFCGVTLKIINAFIMLLPLPYVLSQLLATLRENTKD